MVAGDDGDSSLRNVKRFKYHAETALLKYVLEVTGQKPKIGLKFGVSGKTTDRLTASSLRSKIRYNLIHPRLSQHERNFIYASLMLIDRFVIKNRQKIEQLEIKGPYEPTAVFFLSNAVIT